MTQPITGTDNFRRLVTLHRDVFNIGARLTLFSMVFILGVTMFPYNFTMVRLDSLLDPTYLAYVFLTWQNWPDILLNITMFLPVGIGVAALRWANGRDGVWFWSFFFGLLFSLGLEAGQLLLPSRHVALADVVANTSGSVVGAWLFVRYKLAILDGLQRFRGFATPHRLLFTAVAYLALLFVFTLYMQGRMTLDSWQESFHLVMGNELTGDRTWRGEITRVQIAAHAVGAEEVKSLFQERPLKNRLADVKLAPDSSAVATGNLPRLVHGIDGSAFVGVDFDARNWLVSDRQAECLNAALRDSGEVTIVLDLTPIDTLQTGPARIFSLSRNVMVANLTIGQEGPKLVFRLRNGISGQNGHHPALYSDDIIVPGAPHRIVATYDGQYQKIYVNSHETASVIAYDLGMSVFSLFAEVEIQEQAAYRIWYYGLIALPLGLLAALALAARQKSGLRNSVMPGSVSLFLWLMFEYGVMSFGVNYHFNILNVIIAWLSSCGSLFLLRFDFSNHVRLSTPPEKTTTFTCSEPAQHPHSLTRTKV